MSLLFKKPSTGEEKKVGFPWHWILTPLCSLDLLSKGMIFMGLLAGFLFHTYISFQMEVHHHDRHGQKGYDAV